MMNPIHYGNFRVSLATVSAIFLLRHINSMLNVILVEIEIFFFVFSMKIRLGRPVIYGLAVNGKNGCENVLQILKDELNATMSIAGVCSVQEINTNYIAHGSEYKIN